MEFDENNGSQVEQSGLCDVGDEIPPQAIRRMGVGYFLPVEEPLVAEGEGQCSTQVEPSPTHDPHASEEQSEGPQPRVQDQGQDQLNGDDSTSHDAQDLGHTSVQAQDQDEAQVQDQAQDQGQAKDQDHAQDHEQAGASTKARQVTKPQLSMEEILERRAAKIASKLRVKQHLLKNVYGSLKRGVTTVVN